MAQYRRKVVVHIPAIAHILKRNYSKRVRIVNLLDHGPLPYMSVDGLQRYLHAEVAGMRQPDSLIVWESQETYTAGRRTQPEDIPNDGVPVIAMDRGGSVTYHGPGQLVIYPIVRVRPPKDVVAFVRNTEIALIGALDSIGLQTKQVDGRSGVWVDASRTPWGIESKLCAIGIKFASDTTMHGMALNVTTDMTAFTKVVPCGITDAGVVSLNQLGYKTTLSELADVVTPALARAYAQFQLRPVFDADADLFTVDGGELLDRALKEPSDKPLHPGTGVAWSRNKKVRQQLENNGDR